MKVVWSEQAEKSYEEIIDFILKQWNVSIALEFESITNQTIQRIKNNPELCPPVKSTILRKCVIHKNVSLIYLVQRKTVIIIAFVDNRSKHYYE